MRAASTLRTGQFAALCMTLLCISVAALARGPENTHSVQVGAGWNLLSVPARVTNGSRVLLFPSAVSPAYVFQYPAGYVAQDTLHNGTGFWLKFNSADTVFIDGEMVLKDTLEVHQGWNIIGGLSVPIAVSSIQTDPPGIVASQFFGYDPGGGYQQDTVLQPGQGYWVKVTDAGSMILSSSGVPCPGIPTVDYAGKTYNTVLIGTQCWLRENLDVGTMVLGAQSQTDNDTIEKYCYDDNPANCITYGGLYQWDEAMQYDTTEGVQGICPPGWHMPAYSEFQTLAVAVGFDGNALKRQDQGSGGGAGTNTSGFASLLAGYRNNGGGFDYHGQDAGFWSSTTYDASRARDLYLHSYDDVLYLNHYDQRTIGISVRCLKDEAPNLPPNEPSNPSPPDGALGQAPAVMLGWTCSDPDSDALTYDVYFGSINPPGTMVSSNHPSVHFGVSGLSGAVTYYWKIVARDEHGATTAGPVWSFTTGTIGGSPCPGTPTVEYGGKTYNTVQIGSQCWLRENLEVGTMVLGAVNQTDNGTIEKYCYDDNSANCITYGGLYQWNEAMQYDTAQGSRGICPPGWHLPTRAEFQTCSTAVGGDGNALKAIGQGTGAGAGANTSGFSALLAGGCSMGTFGELGQATSFWSSMSRDSTTARLLRLYDSDAWIDIDYSGTVMGHSIRCLKDEVPNSPPDAPSEPTPDSLETNVWTSPTLSWICSDPDADPLTYDVYFGVVNPPDTMVSSNQTDTTLARTGLAGGTIYYWRVVAKDDHAHSTTGSVWSFTTTNMGYPCPGTPTVDYAGKIYNTVQIGTQCWLRENLDVGTMVPGSQNQANNGTIEKYCYNDSLVNCDTYGGLYQWDETMQYVTTQGTRGICPPGWHLPTSAEFLALSSTVGGNGNALKAIGQGSGSGTGTNTSGFSALLAGYRRFEGGFDNLGIRGSFWSSTRSDATYVFCEILGRYDANFLLYTYSKPFGFSVRCLED